jgi:hypothetical protein
MNRRPSLSTGSLAAGFLASLALLGACSTSSPPTGGDGGSTSTTDSGGTPAADATAPDASTTDAGSGADGSSAADTGIGTCTYDGKTYNVGDTFPATDGCNSCQCVAAASVACTKALCVDAAADGGYVCPKDGTINCMPIIPPANVPLCTGPYHAWIVANCPGVMFVY